MTANSFTDTLFAHVPQVRYAALYQDGRLHSAARPELRNASSSESDKYEELIVNPVLLKLLQQRGNIDCGGLEYVLIRYGSFFELVFAHDRGHVSVGFEPDSSLDQVITRIRELTSGYSFAHEAPQAAVAASCHAKWI